MRRISRTLILLAAALAVVAAACSTSDDADTTTTTADAATTTEAPTTTEEMTDTTETTIDTETTEAATPDQSIAGIVATSEGFSTLLAAVEAADLVETLDTGGPFTVFAPTDDAFAKLPEGTVEGLLEDTEALTDVLLYHVVEGEVPAEDVVNLESATTLQGSDVAIIVDNGVFLNEDVQVIATNVFATNGVVHVVDSVLLPPGS
jgi:uncharacterized surface protein with fasciclin (FAS1) repeats